MKLAQLDNPVMSSWLDFNGCRLDSKPYLSGATEAKALLAKLPVEKEPLANLTKGHFGGIYNGPQFVRNYVDSPEHSVPFLTSASMLLADLSNVGRLSKKDAFSPKLNYLRIEDGMTLISCSGTIGRMVYAGSYMSGMWSSQDILKVVPDPDKILPGYLYAYLSSKFGVPQVVGGTYGAIIQHIEPRHIADLPVPRLGKDVEEATHKGIIEAARLHSEYQTQIKEATNRLFSSVGLKDITAAEWHAMGPDLGFVQMMKTAETLRASNFNPRLQKLLTKLAKTNHMLLGDICRGGELQRGLRFKRVECDPEYGVKLIGQRELFWLEPEGRWISLQHAPNGIFVGDETVLVTSQGALSDAFARVEFVTGSWVKYAYTEHLLRVKSGNNSIPNTLLFAFLRSETAFRCLRSFCIGSAQQDIHHSLLSRLPIPIPPEATQRDIDNLIKSAYKKRHEASRLEKEAVARVEQAIQKGARSQILKC